MRGSKILALLWILSICSVPLHAQDIDYDARLQEVVERYQPYIKQVDANAPLEASLAPTPTHKVNVMPDQMVWMGQPMTVWGNSNTTSGTYEWDFGDSTPKATGTVTDKHYIKVDHTYVTAGSYTATLTILESGTPAGSDQVKITVVDKTTLPTAQQLQGDVNIAIEDGLEYLYRVQANDGSWNGAGYVPGPTGFAVLTFLNQGYRASADPTITDNEIYAEYIQAGLNYLFSHTYPQTLSVQPAGDPDPGGLGGYHYGSSRPLYETGMVLMAIASTGSPGATVTVGPASGSYVDLTGKTYKQVAEGIVRYVAWAQNENGGGRGGWRYGPNYGDSDNSNAQWPVIGLQAAERLFGIPIPAWVKSELEIWIQHIQKSPVGAPDDNSSGYTNSDQYNNTAKTGALLAQMELVGDTRSTLRVITAMDYIENHWSDTKDEYGWWEITHGNIYAIYSVFKGLANLRSTPGAFPWYELPGGFNWREAVDQYLVGLQAADGSWNGSQWFDQDLGTAGAVLSLSRTVVGAPFVTAIATTATAFPVISLNLGVDSTAGQAGTLTSDKFEVLENQTAQTISTFTFDSTSKTYTLTYTTGNPEQDGSHREVLVRVTDPDKGVGFSVSSYTAPLTGVIVRIPDVTVKRNQVVTIPVNISYIKTDGTPGNLSTLNITGVELNLRFPNAFLVARDVTMQGALANWNPFFHISNGNVHISLAGTSVLSGNSGVLVSVEYLVRGTAPVPRRVGIEITSIEINEGAVSPRAFPGVLSTEACTIGDVNGDGNINSADASLVLQYTVGLLSLPNPSYLCFVLETADVSNNGTIGALDAYYILAYEAGIITSFPRTTAAPMLARAGDAPRLAGIRLISMPKGLLAVPLRVSDLREVQSAEMLLAYDRRALRFVRLAPMDASILQASSGEDGTLRIALAGTLQSRGDVLATALFERVGTGQDAAVELMDLRLNEGNIPVLLKQHSRPEVTMLWQNYPNPFNPETWIPYQLHQRADVQIRIYDVTGKLIRHLSLGSQDPGVYLERDRAAYWDGRNLAGEPAGSGIYFYTFQAGDFTATRRLLLVK